MTFWATTGCTATGGQSDPTGGANAIEINKSSGSIANGLRQAITSNEFEGKEVAMRVWLLASSAAASDKVIEIALRNDTASVWLPVKSVAWISGHYPTLSTDDGAVFENLSPTIWSEVEIVWDAVAADLDCYVFFAPNLISTASGTVDVYRPQLQHSRVENTAGLVTTGVRKTEAINGPEGAPGETITLRLSNNGWATAPTDTPANFHFGKALQEPYNLRVAPFMGADFRSRISPSVGEIVIANPDGEFDDLLGWSWDNRDITLYEGKWGNTFAEFLPYSKGTSSGVSGEQHDIAIQYTDAMQLLNKDLQDEEYKGLGMALRFDGAGDYCGFGANGWLWSLYDDITLEAICRFYADPGKKVIVFDKSDTTAGEPWNRVYSLRIDWPNYRLEYEHEYGATPSLETHNSGSSTIPTAYKTDGLWHHYGVKLKRSTKTLIFLLDGEEIATTTYTNEPTEGYQGGFRLGRENDSTSLDFKGDVAEARFFRSLRSPEDIKKFSDRSLTDLDVEGLAGLWRLNEGTGTTAGNEIWEEIWNAGGKFDGVDDGAATAATALTIATSFTVAVWFQPTSLDNFSKFIFGSGSWNAARILLRTSADPGNLQWEIESSTGSTVWRGVSIPASDAASKLMCMVLVFDDSDSEIRSYVNYDEDVRSWDYTRSGNWNLGVLAVGSNNSITTNFFGGQVFQAAIWDRALSAEEIEALNDDGLIDLTDSNLKAAWDFRTWNDLTPSNKDFTTVTGAAIVKASGTVTNATWVGSGEGGIDLLGKAKPTITGRVHHVEPLLLDPWNYVYQIAEGPIEQVETVYEGGDEKTLEETSNPDIWAVTPTLEFAVNLESGLLLAKDAPSYPVTVDVKGDNSDTGYAADAGSIIKRLATRRGGFTYPDKFNVPTFDVIDQTTELGIYTGVDNMNLIQGMNWIMSSLHGTAYMDRSALLSVLQVPEIDGATVFTFQLTVDDILDLSIQILPIIPSWRERVKYAPYWRTLTDSEVVGAAAGKKADLSQQYRTVTESDETIKEVWKSSESVETETLIYSAGAATTEAAARFARSSVGRRFIRAVIPLGVVGMNIGAVGRLVYPRWGIQIGGMNAFVYDHEEDASNEQIQVRLWG